jgi:phosphohistidine phosphatase
MTLVLVHHADALAPGVDSKRPLSARGREEAQWLAGEAKARGVRPAAIWHSGKLRARETAYAFLQACAPFATFTMVRGLAPGDPPEITCNLLNAEDQDLLAVGHMPNIAAVLERLSSASAAFPLHGAVALERGDDVKYVEVWRVAPAGY